MGGRHGATRLPPATMLGPVPSSASAVAEQVVAIEGADGARFPGHGGHQSWAAADAQGRGPCPDAPGSPGAGGVTSRCVRRWPATWGSVGGPGPGQESWSTDPWQVRKGPVWGNSGGCGGPPGASPEAGGGPDEEGPVASRRLAAATLRHADSCSLAGQSSGQGQNGPSSEHKVGFHRES